MIMNSKTKTPQIVGIGEVVFDILPDSRKLGGAPADFLAYAAKCGSKTYLISAVGADDLGREVVSELNKFEINPVLAVTPYPTGRVLVFNTPNNNHSAHILENAAWDYIPYTSAAEKQIKKADAVYFDTLALRNPYSQSTILDLIDEAGPNAYKFFDINLRQNYYNQTLIEKLLQRADILKLNSEELKILKNFFKLNGTIEEMCLKLKKDYQLKYILLTNGTKENFVWGDNALTSVQNVPLKQNFAFGTGNAFAGVFMSCILNGMSQKDAHETANKVAVELCSSLDS